MFYNVHALLVQIFKENINFFVKFFKRFRYHSDKNSVRGWPYLINNNVKYISNLYTVNRIGIHNDY